MESTVPDRRLTSRRKLFFIVCTVFVSLQLQTAQVVWRETAILEFYSGLSGLGSLNVSTMNNNSTATEEIRPEEPSSVRCLDRRGDDGKWVQDWDYANRTHYNVYGSYDNWHVAEHKFKSTSSAFPYRWATTWRWDDANCPVQEISYDSFCRVCWELNLTRFLFVGDSLSVQFLFSLLSLIGYPPKNGQFSFRGMLKPFTIPCRFHDNQAIVTREFQTTLWMYRRSPVGDLVQLRDEAQSRQFTKYHDFLVKNPNRTAIVANTGAWINTMEDYREAFGSLLEWLDSVEDKSKVLAFFRPTLPGHLHCRPRGNDTEKEVYNWTDPVDLQQPPYRDYDEYLQTTQEIIKTARKQNETLNAFNWLEIESFNDYSKDVLRHNRSNDKDEDRFLPIHWLNVFNSTILRRDGHVGFNDCLHYSVPGPTDWWVHFFHSMLWDFVAEEWKQPMNNTFISR